jgi:2-octaprenyl-6-methoxyphenol hydroxylase
MNRTDFDIAIAGGGPVGAALAAALAETGFNVIVLEARAATNAVDGGRTLAMSHGSRLILERIGAWQDIEPVTEIRSIHVSQQGGFGRTLLTAAEADLPALGYVVRYSRLQQSLASAAGSTEALISAGSEVVGADPGPDSVVIAVRRDGSEIQLRARLLVVADGGASIDNLPGARTKILEYGQDAVVALVRSSRFHDYRAYERFTPDGPVALLPFEDRYALVWTAQAQVAKKLVELPPAQFLSQLQAHFGDRAGRFLEIQARGRFPLALRFAQETVLKRTVLLGNAAQTLHPIAGQGFNLGLRDAWELGEFMRQQGADDPGADSVLRDFRAARRIDRFGGIALTHSLVRIFSNDILPLRAARGASLTLLDMLPFAKRVFARRMIFGGSL